MLVPNTPTNNPAYNHHAEVSMLAGTKDDGTAVLIKADSAGNITTVGTASGLGWTESGDAWTLDDSGSNTRIYSLRTGGVSGTVVQTITLTYSDASKSTVISAARATP